MVGSLKADYSRLLLHEVVDLSEIIIEGKITSVDELDFQVNINEVLKGEINSNSIKIKKFKNWTCTSRWGKYEVNHRGIFALQKKNDEWQIIGAGNEGEMPIENESLFFITIFGLKGGDTYKRYSSLKFNLNEAKDGIKEYLKVKEELQKMIENKTILKYNPENEFLKKIKIELILRTFYLLNLSDKEREEWLKLYSEKK